MFATFTFDLLKLRWIGQKFQTSSPFFGGEFFHGDESNGWSNPKTKITKKHTSKKVVERFLGGDSGGVFCFSNKNPTLHLDLIGCFVRVLISLAYEITPCLLGNPLFFTAKQLVTAQIILAQKITVGIWAIPRKSSNGPISIHFPLLFCYARKYGSVFYWKKTMGNKQHLHFFRLGSWYKSPQKKQQKKSSHLFQQGSLYDTKPKQYAISIRENSLQNHQQPFA